MQNLRGKGCKGCDQVGRADQKDPRIPRMTPVCQHRLCAGQIGLFDKAAQGLRHGREIGGGLRQFQPAIARLGPIRLDAKGDNLPRLRRGHGCQNRRAKLRVLRDHMIRGGDDHQGPRFGLVQQQGCGQNGGRGVARFGFDQGRLRRRANGGQLIFHDKAKV